MPPDLMNIFNPEPTKQKADPRVSLALFLRHLADLMSAEDEDEDMREKFKDEREKQETEIPVRPRVEPLGGA